MKLRIGKIWWAVLGGMIAVLLILRLLLPGIIRDRLNAYLETFSEVYAVHVGQVEISFLTMSYGFGDLEARYKHDGRQFFTIESVNIGLAFRELLHFRVLADVSIRNGEFFLTHDLFGGKEKHDGRKSGKKQAEDNEETADKVAHSLFLIRVTSVQIHDSSVDFAELVKLKATKRWRLSSVEARIFNVTPLPADPVTYFTAQGTLLDSAKVKLAGKAKKLDQPMAWKLDIQLKDFDLLQANPILLNLLPFTFTAGELDLYSELRSQAGLFEGYVKPFLRKAQILKNNNEIHGAKQFAFEVIGAAANAILKRSDDKSVATRIAFHREGESLKVDTGQAVSKTLQHGFQKPIQPSIEDSLDLK